jgi:hypothetical protein
MQPEEIKDRETLKAWLKTRSHQECIWIAHRAAARVAPVWFEFAEGRMATSLVFTSLLVLRPLILSGTASNYLVPKIRDIAFSAAARVRAPASDASGFAASSVRTSSVRAASTSARAVSASTHAVFASGRATLAIWVAVQNDCLLLDKRKLLEGVPLWHDQPNPLETQWQATRTEWQAPNSPYRFWLRWYEAALQGHHLNLDLEQDIALIPDQDWKKGPDHIATLIDALEERHDLKAQVIALRNQLRELKQRSASVAHRSHNQPPELVDAPTTLNRHVTVVVAALEEAEAELEKPIPDASAIARLGKLLVEAAIRLTKYCGTLADTGLKKAAEELGTTGTKWSIRLIAGDLLIKAEPVQTLGQALISYAQKILAGG